MLVIHSNLTFKMWHMKRYLLIKVCYLLLNICLQAQEDTLTYYYTIREEGLYGLMNEQGEVVVAPEYSVVLPITGKDYRDVKQIEDFVFSLSKDRKKYKRYTDKLRLMPSANKRIIALYTQGIKTGRYASTLPRSALVVAELYNSYKYKHIDNPSFFDSRISFFYEGLAVFKKRGKNNFPDKYGFINPKHEIVIPASYDYVNGFKHGLAKFSKGHNRYTQSIGFINKKNKIVIPADYDSGKVLASGNIQVVKGVDTLFFDNQGELINISKKIQSFPKIQDKPSKIYKYIQDKKTKEYLVVNDEVTDVVIDRQDFIYPLEGNLFKVLTNGYRVEIDKKQGISSPIFNFHQYSRGAGVVKKNKKYGLKNLYTQVNIVPCIYDSIRLLNNYRKLYKNKKVGLASNKKLIIPVLYDDILPVYQLDFFLVKKKKKYGLYNSYGKIVLPLDFDEIQMKGPNWRIKAEFKKNWIATVVKNGIEKDILITKDSLSIVKDWNQERESNIIDNAYLQGPVPYHVQHQTIAYGTQQLNEYQGIILQKGDLKAGIFDRKTKKMIVSPIYDDMALFDSKFLSIRKNDKYGLLAVKTYQVVLEPIYTKIQKSKQEGIIEFTFEKEGVTTKGAINESGKIIAQPIYRKLFLHKNQTTIGAFLDSTYVSIDTTGNSRTVHFFKEKRGYLQGVAPVLIGHKWGMVDKKDRLISEYLFDKIEKTSKGSNHYFATLPSSEVVIVFKNGKMTFKDADHSKVKFTNCFPFEKNGKYGLKDKQGKIRLAAKYNKLIFDNKGFINIQLGEKWGYVDTIGKIFIKPKYLNASNFHKDKVIVSQQTQNGIQYGLIDSKENIILPFTYDKIQVLFKGQIFSIEKGGKIGVLDNNCDWLLPIEYSELKIKQFQEYPHTITEFQKHPFIPSICLLYKNDSITFIKETGEILGITENLEFKQFLTNNLLLFKQGNKWGVKNILNNENIAPPIFEQYSSKNKTLILFPKMAYLNKQGIYVWKEKGFDHIKEMKEKSRN